MQTKKLAIALLILAACSPKPQDETAAAVDSTPAPAPDTGWVVSLTGAGAFTPGMPLAAARSRIPNLEAPAAPAEGCDYASIAGTDRKLSFLIVDDKLARFDVSTTDVATDLGIRIGDSEAKVKAAYGANVIVQPHKYTNGRYLIVNNPADTMIALVFETDSTSNVTRYRLGTKPVVQWVEGCS